MCFVCVVQWRKWRKAWAVFEGRKPLARPHDYGDLRRILERSVADSQVGAGNLFSSLTRPIRRKTNAPRQRIYNEQRTIPGTRFVPRDRVSKTPFVHIQTIRWPSKFFFVKKHYFRWSNSFSRFAVSFCAREEKRFFWNWNMSGVLPPTWMVFMFLTLDIFLWLSRYLYCE